MEWYRQEETEVPGGLFVNSLSVRIRKLAILAWFIRYTIWLKLLQLHLNTSWYMYSVFLSTKVFYEDYWNICKSDVYITSQSCTTLFATGARSFLLSHVLLVLNFVDLLRYLQRTCCLVSRVIASVTEICTLTCICFAPMMFKKYIKRL